MSKVAIAAVASLMLVSSTPALAGEVTGSGKDIDINSRSECAFSGLNDNDGDPRDPGGRAQSYGQNVRLTPLDPSQQDPTNAAGAPFVPIPGWACNPNRGRDLHDD
jgi:hypothetical protein